MFRDFTPSSPPGASSSEGRSDSPPPGQETETRAGESRRENQISTAPPASDRADVDGAPDRMARNARFRLLVRVGARMMFHDRFKLAGTVSGVVFAVVLAVQQLAVLFGLLHKNTMFVDNAGAQVWITPPGTELLQGGTMLPEGTLEAAQVADGVELAAPLVFAGATIAKPGGGAEPLTLVGTELPSRLGGPWNVVAGSPEALREPNTLLFEDSERSKFGSLNEGSVREVNGKRVRAGGFVWGLLPFGPAYTFAEIDEARQLTGTPDRRYHYVLVRANDGRSPAALAAQLQSSLPQVKVMTADTFHDSIVSTLLKQQLGVSFGTSTAFGLIIGFVIVALAMFTSVLDNLREFGTLKALGAKNRHLTLLLLAQSFGYALVGSFVGLGLASWLAGGIRSPKLTPLIPTELFIITPIVMTVICLAASLLAVWRIRNLDPGVVFK